MEINKMIKLKNLIKEEEGIEIQTTKFNLKINLDGEIKGNEQDVLKFKKKIESEIQEEIDDFKVNATWRLD